MAMEMTTQEMIAELERIHDLNMREYTLDLRLDNAEREQERLFATMAEKKKSPLRTLVEEKFNRNMPDYESAHMQAPPALLPKPEELNLKKVLFGVIVGLANMVLVPLLIIMMLMHVDSGWFVLEFLLMAGLIIAWVIGRNYVRDYTEWKTKRDPSESQRGKWEFEFNMGAADEAYDDFLQSFQEYDAFVLETVDVCTRKCEEAAKAFEEEFLNQHIKMSLETQALRQELTAIEDALEAVTLIDEDYFDDALRIATKLKYGKASTLDMAIYLVEQEDEQEEREERQRAEEERELETMNAQLRAIAQMTKDLAAQNAAEQKRALEEERRALRAARQREEDAKWQARRDKEQAREAARRQQKEAEKAAAARCRHCANSMKCHYKVKLNSLSCAAYRPQ